MAEFMRIYDQQRGRRPNRRARRVLPIISHLEKMDDVDLYERYRFDRGGIQFLVNLIEEDIRPPSNRSRAIPAEIQVLVALRYYASGAYQKVLSDTFAITQPSVSRIIARVTDAFLPHLRRFVNFPAAEEQLAAVRNGLYDMAGFPGVVGLIDCTHVRIIAPFQNEGDFVNRKGFHSMNIQAVCDHRGKFTNVNAQWPGSAHDSWILRQSRIYDDFESGRKRGLVLGDSGYAARNWLLTPYLNPATVAERRYNSAHKCTRVLIEQTFGRLKRRFGLLHGEIRQSPEMACKIVGVCAMLHNIAVDRKLPVDDGWVYEEEDQPDPVVAAQGLVGRARRDQIANALFGGQEQ